MSAEAADGGAAPLHIVTPLIESRALSLRTGHEVWLKMEAMQPPGSFKLRGVGLACQTHAQRGATRFVSSSGGNAGIAVAYAGRKLGLPVDVVVPETTSARARELIALQGARLTVHGASWQEANELAQSMLGPTDAFIHPFDDPLLWSGHATSQPVTVEPKLEPNTTHSAEVKLSSPALTKPMAATVVAVEDCTSAVSKTPVNSPCSQVRVQASSMRSSARPAASLRPSVSMVIPSRNNPSPPSRETNRVP